MAGLDSRLPELRYSSRAELACRDCLARNPGNKERREQLAALRMDASDYQEASRDLEILLRNGRATKTVLDGLGFSLLRNGEYFPGDRSVQAFARHVWIRFLDSLEPGIPLPAARPDRSGRAAVPTGLGAAPGDAEKNHDLGFALYLARDYASALPRLKPPSG